MKLVDTSKSTVYSDLPGYTVGAGSIPPELCITVEKPDIVIQDKSNKFIHLFELSVPIETNGNIDKRHKDKSDKYAHFVTNMSGYDCAVTAFKIGSRKHISARNHSDLYTLHKFVKPGVKLDKFKQNIAALAIFPYFYHKKRSSFHGTFIPSPTLSMNIYEYL